MKLSVRDGALDLGIVRVCTVRHSDAQGARQTFGALAAVVVVLWGLAGMASRRITRPSTTSFAWCRTSARDASRAA